MVLGLLRESDSNSKLWYWDFNNGDEILIMDIELIACDTFLNLKAIEFDYISPNCGFYARLKFEEYRGLNFSFSLSANEEEAKLLRWQTKDLITINYLENFGFGTDC